MVNLVILLLYWLIFLYCEIIDLKESAWKGFYMRFEINVDMP